MMRKLVLGICIAAGVFFAMNKTGRNPVFSAAPGSVPVTYLVDGVVKIEPLNLKGKRYLAAYHGASWCPPCQTFSPSLASFYRKANRNNFTLLMVNYDRSPAAMHAYMKQHDMQFPAVARSEAGEWGAATGSGIPNLVIIDTLTGKVVDSSYDGDNYKGPMAPLKTLEKLIAQ
jgi:thiol-disulfide isomerase/thioredoxin